MEKHNAVQKYIPKLNVQRNGLDTVITDQKDIEKETYTYYWNLFKNHDEQLETRSIENFLGTEIATQSPKLSNSQRELLEGDIALEELSSYLKIRRITPLLAAVDSLMNSLNFFGGI